MGWIWLQSTDTNKFGDASKLPFSSLFLKFYDLLFRFRKSECLTFADDVKACLRCQWLPQFAKTCFFLIVVCSSKLKSSFFNFSPKHWRNISYYFVNYEYIFEEMFYVKDVCAHFTSILSLSSLVQICLSNIVQYLEAFLLATLM